MKRKLQPRFFALLILFIFLSGAGVLAEMDKYVVRNPLSWENGADYLVISPKELREPLLPLFEKRESDGLRVAVVTPDKIYKYFDRYPAGPKAIHAFVKYAYHHWEQPGPKYLLLVGDFNVMEKYDSKGVQVPPFLIRDGDDFTATDNMFGDVDEDWIPDIAVGRLPADTAEQAEAMAAKIVAFEKNPEPGPWRRRLSAFASTGGFGAYDTTIEELSKRIIRNNIDPVFDMTFTYANPAMAYFLPPEEFGPKVIERFNEGALLLMYAGHGGVTGMSGVEWKGVRAKILEAEDVPSIAAAGRNTFFFSICCQTGSFHLQDDCIAEELVKHPGGPVGAFAASDNSGPYCNAVIAKDVMHFLTQRRPKTIGEGLLDVWRGLLQRMDPERKFMNKHYKLVSSDKGMKETSTDHIMLYNYFGDPATIIPYAEESISITAPERARAGDTIQVEVHTKDAAPGKLLLTLEAVATSDIHEISDLEGLEGDELKETIHRNYTNANDKTAARVETELDGNGAAHAAIAVPSDLPEATYFIKAYAWGTAPDSMGKVEIFISNDRMPASEPGLKKVQADEGPEPDYLELALAELKEPDVSEYVREKKAREADRAKSGPSKEELEKMEKEKKEKEEDVKARRDEIVAAAAREGADLKTLRELSWIYSLEKNPAGLFETLKRMEALDPGPEDLRYMADIYRGYYQYEKDAELNKKGIEKAPDDFGFRHNLARAYRDMGKFDMALETIKEAALLDPDKTRVNRFLAETYKQMGENEKAENAYLELEKTAGRFDWIHTDIYYYYRYDLNDEEKAKAKLRRMIEDGSIYSAHPRYLLSVEMGDDGKNVKLPLEVLWKYYKIEGKKYPKALAVAAAGSLLAERYYYRIPRFKVKKYLEKALEISPGCVECLTVGWNSLHLDDAVERCEKAMEIEPENTETYRCLEWTYIRKRNYKKAVEYIEKRRELDPGRLYRDEILEYFRAGDREKGVEILEGAEEIADYLAGDREENAMLNRMYVYWLVGEFERAEEIYAEYAEKNPYSYEVHDTMAELAERKANRREDFILPAGEKEKKQTEEEKDAARRVDYRRAAELEKKALEINPYCRECLERLVRCGIEIGQYGDAEDALRRAVELSPGNLYLQASLGDVYLKRGDKEKAREAFRAVLDKSAYQRQARKGLLELIDDGMFFN